MANCPKCHGKGRVVYQTLFGQGHKPPLTLPEIGFCPDCLGSGTQHCCEGDRETTVLKAIENLATDVNPNETDDLPGAPS